MTIQDRTALEGLIDDRLADNGAGEITAAKLREVFDALVESTGNRADDLPLSGKNYALNPHFDEWARGSSFSLSAPSTPKSAWCADGWIADVDISSGTTGEGTVTREEFTLGQSDVPGNPRYFLRYSQTTAAENGTNIEHRIGEVRELSATTVCISVWLRCQTGTLTLSPRMQQVFGDGGSTRVDVSPNESDWTITTSWARYFATFDLPSISSKTLGTPLTGSGPSLDFSLFGPSGSTFQFDMAQFKIEIGGAPTPVVREHAAAVRERCRERFERISNLGISGQTFLEGQMISASAFRGTLRYAPKTPGYTPTIAFSALSTFEINSAGLTSTPSALTAQSATEAVARLNATVSGHTAGQAASLRSSVANHPVDATIDISAEF